LENIMSRLFTLGCSFTQYWRWPTWADALGREFDHFENWGLCGAGNSYILWSLIECNQRNKLNKDDEVWVMWSNTSREDRYVGDRWLEGGNVYWSAGSALPSEYVKKFACERGYLIRDLANIAAAKQLLDHWGCRYRFLSMVPFAKTNEQAGLGYNPDDVKQENQDVRELYADVLNTIGPSVLDVVFKGDWQSRSGIKCNFDPKRRDFHPTPLEHVEYLEKIAPGTLGQSTIDWMTVCNQRAVDNMLEWREPNRPERL
jgi:hypothetical protein